MNTQKTPHMMNTQNALEDIKVSLKLKLAMLWASVMFFYSYVDYFHLYMPGKIENLLKRRVFEFNITPGFILVALVLVTIPALMIFLSVALPAKVNRRANIIVALMYIPFTLFNLAGTTWLHMMFGAVVEVALLCLVIRYAWKWPRIQT